MSEEKKNIVDSSLVNDKDEWQELYLYSLRKMAEQNLESSRNLITDLFNFRAFLYKSSEIMLETPNQKYAMIVLDIANFKTVNEFCGRSEGDRVLRAIADGLREYEGECSVVSQFRADNFGLFLIYEDEQDLINITKKISEIISDLKLACKVLPAFGICVTSDTMMLPTLMKDYATMAMKTIKGKFYANYAFFDTEMRSEMLLEKQIENNIVEALETKQFRIYIQPKVDMRSGKIIGGEALIRWKHPIRGIIEPGVFIPVLEKNGFIINVDTYVWTEVFKMLGRRIKEKKQVIPISVNISRLHAYQKDFKDSLCELSEKYQVPPSYVMLELTESGFLENSDMMFEEMKQLKEAGFPIAIDDFGTGYSTLTMLKNQTVDEIKIDKSLIDDIEDEKGKIIINHTISMLKELDLRITVEGVETKEQKEFLLKCGCNEAQGYYFYRPMPVEEFENLINGL